MNTVESHFMTSPNYKTEKCAKFTIDDISQVFSINEIMVIGREYTFSCWVRSDTASSMIVEDKAFSTMTEWTYVTHTFIADQVDLHFAFVTTGSYYIYHAQLELGNKATDWEPAPEDTEQTISDVSQKATDAQIAADNVRVKYDELMSENGVIDLLQKTVDNLEPIAGYIKMRNGTIELGDEANPSKLQLTPTMLMLTDGGDNVAWIAAKKMYISSAVIDKELNIGGFIWTRHGTKRSSDGNTILKSRTGLLWTGGN